MDVARVSRIRRSVSSCMESPKLHVETRERLVHQHHGGTRHDRACQRNTLLLAAREDVRILVPVTREPHARKHAEGFPTRVLARQRLQAEGDVVEDGEMRKQRRSPETSGPRHASPAARTAYRSQLRDRRSAPARWSAARCPPRSGAGLSCRNRTARAGTRFRRARCRAKARPARPGRHTALRTSSKVSRAQQSAAPARDASGSGPRPPPKSYAMS